jgi:hypothetical protein
MFKGFNNRQQHSFPNINFGGNYGQAYNFSRCLLWLDAAYGTSTVVNGANVSSWVDKINGVQYTQATAGNQPTYVASDASFNNFPTINFGNNNSRRLAGNSAFALGRSTLALIVRNTAINAITNSLIIGDGVQTGFSGGGSNANITGFGYYLSSTPFTRSNVEDTNMHIVLSNVNFIIVDGVNQTSATSTFAQDFSFIGSTNGGSTPNCIISEILIYDYLMSETEAIQLSSNINAKYLKY